jgi:Fe-S cluster assembly protein SufB
VGAGRNHAQEADTGTKMIHLVRTRVRRLFRKAFHAGHANNSYRGLVKVMPKAENARNYTQCDSMLIGSNCSANTFPYIEVMNNTRRSSMKPRLPRSAKSSCSI